MAATAYFGNRVAIYMCVAGTTLASSHLILVSKDFKAEPSFETAEYYGAGSIARQGVARHTAKIEVSFKTHKVDLSAGSDLLKIISGNATTDIGTLEVGTGDSSTPTLFDLYIFPDRDTATAQQTVVVEDVMFDKFPFGGDDTNWMEFEFSGTAGSFAIVSDTIPGAT